MEPAPVSTSVAPTTGELSAKTTMPSTTTTARKSL